MGDRSRPRLRLSPLEHEAVVSARAQGLELKKLVASEAARKLIKDETHADGRRSIEYVSDIRTVEDALKHAGIDTSIWMVERSLVNKWSMGYKNKEGDAKTQQLWQVKVWLKRRVPEALVDAMEAIHKRAAEHSPKYRVPKTKLVKDGHLVELALYDIHFGKLAWAQEGTNNYDLPLAELVFENAVEDLLAYIKQLPISQVVIPVGNDFLHVDNKMLTTAAGTEQGAQTEGRYAKIVETGFMAMVRCIERCVQVAPVKVIFVAGNHDTTSTYHIVRELKAWFRHNKRVDVDAGPRARKYFEWGKTLLGYTHGHAETMARLLNLMPVEQPQAWARTRCHEWHTGHLHKRRTHVTKPVDTYEGLTVRVMPSLSGTDAWHYDKGYVSSRAAEAYLYDQKGYVGHFATGPREG